MDKLRSPSLGNTKCRHVTVPSKELGTTNTLLRFSKLRHNKQQNNTSSATTHSQLQTMFTFSLQNTLFLDIDDHLQQQQQQQEDDDIFSLLLFGSENRFHTSSDYTVPSSSSSSPFVSSSTMDEQQSTSSQVYYHHYPCPPQAYHHVLSPTSVEQHHVTVTNDTSLVLPTCTTTAASPVPSHSSSTTTQVTSGLPLRALSSSSLSSVSSSPCPQKHDMKAPTQLVPQFDETLSSLLATPIVPGEQSLFPLSVEVTTIKRKKNNNYSHGNNLDMSNNNNVTCPWDKKRKRRRTTATTTTCGNNNQSYQSRPKKPHMTQISGMAQENNGLILEAKLNQKGGRSYILPLFSPGNRTRMGTKILVVFSSEQISNQGTVEIQYRDSVTRVWFLAFKCVKRVDRYGRMGVRNNGNGSFSCNYSQDRSDNANLTLDKILPWMRAVFKCNASGASFVLFYFGYCNRDDRADRSEQYLQSIPALGTNTSVINQQTLHYYLN